MPPPITSWGEIRTLTQLAWPVVLSQLGLMSMGVVDTLMVGTLGTQELAALGIGNTWAFGTALIGMGAAFGLDPLISQAYGAQKPRVAGAALARGSIVVGTVGLLVMLAHWHSALALVALGQPTEIIVPASTYVVILTASIPPLLGFALLRQFLQGSGQMRLAMWVVGAGNLINIVANWMLIFGNGGAPALGIAGAAWSTMTVRFAMFALLAILALPSLKEAQPWETDLRDLVKLRQVAWMSLPVGAQMALEVWAFGAVTVMAGWLGVVPLAAHAATLNVTSVTFMVPLGISAAASTRVGNLVGAKLPWSTAAWTALAMSATTMGLSALAFITFSDTLANLYVHEAAPVALALSVLPIAALFQLADGAQVTSFGILRGLGDIHRPMVANIIGYWLLGMPLGYALGFNFSWGLTGLWTGLALSLCIVASLLVFRVAYHQQMGVQSIE